MASGVGWLFLLTTIQICGCKIIFRLPEFIFVRCVKLTVKTPQSLMIITIKPTV